jgi:hypothetical protein
VTAELAMALPTLVLVLVVGLYAMAAVALTGRCADAARVVAREVARGEDPAPGSSQAISLLPRGSAVAVDRSPGQAPGSPSVRITVTAPLPVPPPLRSVLPDRRISAVIVAADESAETGTA